MLKLGMLGGLLICLISCSPSTPQQEPKAAITTAEEDAIVSRLAVDLIADPQTQQEKDKNTIINYAIDNMIDAQPHPSGLYYQILEEGEGKKAKWGDYVTANYRGRLINGKTFDTNKDYQFYIGNMIKGWNEGLELLAEGGKAIFLIPSHLAYGEEGLGKLIPPNSVLIFDIELLKITEK